MKKLLMVFALTLAVVTIVVPAFGEPLLSEEFSVSTLINGTGDGIFYNGEVNLNQWLGFKWGIANSGGDYFAQHPALTGDETNLMFYGISAPAPGTGFSLDFEFATEGSRNGTVYVAGLNSGTDSLDPYAGWFDGEGSGSDDGQVLLKGVLGGGLSWGGAHFVFDVPVQYDALVVGFVMGGTSGFRAIDSINLQSTSVPEPSTMLLLGSGLLGLVGYGRKRMKK